MNIIRKAKIFRLPPVSLLAALLLLNQGFVEAAPSFVTWEGAETTTTLTYENSRDISLSYSFFLDTQKEITAFTYTQYTAKIFAVDRDNAQACMNHEAFQGYLMNFQNADGSTSSGVNRLELPAGYYWICSVPGQTPFEGYSNKIGYEVASVDLPGRRYLRSDFLTGGLESGRWKARPFSLKRNQRAYLEAESTGGNFYILKNSQFKEAFSTDGPIPETFWYIDFCSAGSNEMECELTLKPGKYWLVYVNSDNDWNGFAAVIDYYNRKR